MESCRTSAARSTPAAYDPTTGARFAFPSRYNSVVAKSDRDDRCFQRLTRSVPFPAHSPSSQSQRHQSPPLSNWNGILNRSCGWTLPFAADGRSLASSKASSATASHAVTSPASDTQVRDLHTFVHSQLRDVSSDRFTLGGQFQRTRERCLRRLSRTPSIVLSPTPRLTHSQILTERRILNRSWTLDLAVEESAGEQVPQRVSRRARPSVLDERRHHLQGEPVRVELFACLSSTRKKARCFSHAHATLEKETRGPLAYVREPTRVASEKSQTLCKERTARARPWAAPARPPTRTARPPPLSCWRRGEEEKKKKKKRREKDSFFFLSKNFNFKIVHSKFQK